MIFNQAETIISMASIIYQLVVKPKMRNFSATRISWWEQFTFNEM